MCWPSCTNYKFVSIFKGTVRKSNYPMPCNSLEMTPFLLHLPRSYAQLSGNLFTFQMPIHQTSQMHFVCNPCPFCLAIPSQCDTPVPRHEHTHVSISPLWQSLWSLVQVTLVLPPLPFTSAKCTAALRLTTVTKSQLSIVSHHYGTTPQPWSHPSLLTFFPMHIIWLPSTTSQLPEHSVNLLAIPINLTAKSHTIHGHKWIYDQIVTTWTPADCQVFV